MTPFLSPKGRGMEKFLIKGGVKNKGGVEIFRGKFVTETDLIIFSKVFKFIPVNLPKNMFLTSKIDEIFRIRG